MKLFKVSAILTLVLLISTSFTPALVKVKNTNPKTESELKWLGFNEGYSLAKKKNKIMLVDVYTDWCGWCKRMDRDTYTKADIIESLNKDFVVIKFNPEVQNMSYEFEGKKYDGQQLAGVISNYQINGYPTTIFIHPKTKKTNVLSGYYDATRFRGVLDAIKEDFAKK